MRITWPCDFQEKVKLPRAAGGAGYPYRISAEDLMENFKAAADVVPDGLNVGDIMYWDGFKWQILDPPGGSGYVLGSDGSEPYWTQIEASTYTPPP